MPNHISEQRNTIRQQIRASRRELSLTEQKNASQKLFTRLITHPKILKAQSVSVTLAHDGEINLSLFIDWCWKHQKQVCLPVLHPTEEGKLLFIEYCPDTPMIKNHYGITEPKLIHGHHDSNHFINTTLINNLDIVFTPLVAFDIQGNRIGMGGGYYDRLLAPWFTQKTGPYPIGLAHNCQYINELPIQSWDVPLPEIITPNQHFHFNRS
ncbi:5-formyltetrahydrofolate cyclo-ligase [Psychromonas sp. RZ22]|uniref:5-formyltetrahydrofolate cyclo-ligase n=1 Tax=Psychromonas algarum TaxID=2555643 RepID=UPI0010674AAF|nr:5-formyltetrahydrofolate cyclo-ligase [Psychromonas sp. RZ22]TEW53765.1 5-formyltetrahydrofolate cyclo-ligase [Psychromonas sp. RZ22]